MNYYSVIMKAQQYSTLVVLVIIHGTEGISNTLTIHREGFVHVISGIRNPSSYGTNLDDTASGFIELSVV